MRRDVRRRNLSIAIEVTRAQTPHMTHDTFVSITDAAELAGVSKKSVERAYKKFMDHPEFGKMIERREHGSSYRYFVTKTFVDKCVVKQAARRPSGSKEAGDTSNERSVAALIEQLTIKDQRIDKLTEMLQRKEEFNEALIRKGLNLPEGTSNTDRDENSQEAGEVSEAQETSTSIIDAEVINRGEGTEHEYRFLFPTVRRGLAFAGRYLRRDVF